MCLPMLTSQDVAAGSCQVFLLVGAICGAIALLLRIPAPGPCDPVLHYCLYWPFSGGELLPPCAVSGTKFSVTINGESLVCGELRAQSSVVTQRAVTEAIGFAEFEVCMPMPMPMPMPIQRACAHAHAVPCALGGFSAGGALGGRRAAQPLHCR